MPLTGTAIKALKPKAKRYTVTDEKGLVLEVFPTGGMLWHHRYRLNRKQERVTLGLYPALSLKLARGLRDERATLVALGHSPAQQKQLAKVAAADATTVADFGERFFREIVAKVRKNVSIPRRYFDKSILPAIGTKPVRDVTTEDVRAIIWRKKDQGFDAAAGDPRCAQTHVRFRHDRRACAGQPRTGLADAACSQGEITRAGAVARRNPRVPEGGFRVQHPAAIQDRPAPDPADDGAQV